MSLRFNHMKANAGTYQAMVTLEKFASEHIPDKVLYELIKIRVSQINGCSFCLDMHAKDLLKLGEYQNQILLIALWHEVPGLFTEKECAVLELAEAVTLIHKGGVSDDLYARIRTYFSEEEYMNLIMAINTINNWNRIAISTGMYPGCFGAS
ncbi:carboxymuconolactone decarboxylase family protein [Paenibacillus physcomitrellae]|uniref:Alkyl hydroperoxide reductase AhpD n=1 Tax=Paenibacillus physcomitrellae TaxID=1619311 RepID=A0ABQ1FZS4_9BACL|nr:carboxymuconolactone decarboxylase family protein [Paenibacillus physcomitrellae]GGA33817.1 alkyl hydroperoxide reductase AhpD [Paenibacillus physcomitrellae]